MESAYQVQRTDLIETLAELLMILVLHFKQREAVQATMAALWESLSQNHSFVDGNKRIAFVGLGVTLALNGLYLDAREADATEIMFRLAAGEISESEFEAWVRARVVAG